MTTVQSIEKLDELLPDGYRARPTILDDVPQVVALLNLRSQEVMGVDEHDEDDLRNDWTEPSWSLEENSRVVFAPDDTLVGFVEFYATAPYVRMSTWGAVHPEHRGRGIGSYSMEWSHAKAFETMKQAEPHLRIIFESWNYAEHKPTSDLLKDNGFQLARSFYDMLIEMEAEPPKPSWPEGISIRSAVREQDEWDVLVALDEAFEDHWGHVKSDLKERYERIMHHLRNDKDYDPSMWVLAIDDATGEIAGVARNWPKTNEDPDKAWVATLGVRRAYRKKGLGLALLLESFNVCYQRGIMKVGLGVDAENPTGALRLYEKAGMHVDQEFHAFRKELRPGEDIMNQG
ncbi:MAG: GNAT family N-acetyltransferase [Chloroflexi bacterium]|nr:GNAT family N-acetyltransferase [Chloroflexota bacterium]